MQYQDGQFLLSAGALANHLSCRHSTNLDLAAAQGKVTPPFRDDPRLEALKQRGFDHETAYVRQLENTGRDVVRAEAAEQESSEEMTRRLMTEGAGAIVQATLSDGRWRGRADVLLRVEQPSDLGDWSYEPVDTKLARMTRGETILQLCQYADLIQSVQGSMPEHVHVVTPGDELQTKSFRTGDFLGYYRMVKQHLELAVATPLPTAPDPVIRCDTCRWWTVCDNQWREEDHLSLVAGASRLHRKELTEAGLPTVAALGSEPIPSEFKPRRGARESYERLHHQARVQLAQRAAGEPVWEPLPIEENRGLMRLPEPNDGDVFFDIEGDPFVGVWGLEYLFGWLKRDGSQWLYRELWAKNPQEEKRMFENFVDELEKRWERFPDMHVYHFGGYEPGALKRLMGRFATREEALDRMLRGKLFVDLLTVVRQGVRAGIERYSLKDLEKFHGFKRELDLREASLARRDLEVALEVGDEIEASAAAQVRTYNEDDCRSTLGLRDWLESIRTDLIAQGNDIRRPDGRDPEPSEALSQQRQRANQLIDGLRAGLPEDPAQWTAEDQARELLSTLIDWERREGKVAWWEYFRLCDLEPDALLEERAAISCLQFDTEVPGDGRLPTHRYRFPDQETKVSAGDALSLEQDTPFGTVVAIDSAAGHVDIKKRGDTVDVHPISAFAWQKFRTGVLADAVFELGEWVRDHGLDATGPYRAARDLLLRLPPRRVSESSELRRNDETALEAAIRSASELDHGLLAIQGPPGTGKTYTGARLILSLIQAGKKVGVTAHSHAVIENLLAEVVEAAAKERADVEIIRKVTELSDDPIAGVQEATANRVVEDALRSDRPLVAAGTPWLWSRPELRDSVDVLIIDEAGQMALSRTLAVATAAKNFVLLGDPRQLEQPIQGSHPEGAGVSALEHLLDGHQTIPPDRGLFLDVSYRLHPEVCAYTSECFYEGRLQSKSGLERQALISDSPLAGSGLWLCTVEHEGNQVHSAEEVEAIQSIISHLTGPDVLWRDKSRPERRLSLEDVLVVAPFNSQVSLIADRISGVRVGTVDKFQGQQAPVVIYSMTTSRSEDAPRGMEFLYSLNRLNVATSRAQGAVILVASPHLLAPDCRTPDQMKLANAVCVFAERAKRLLVPI